MNRQEHAGLREDAFSKSAQQLADEFRQHFLRLEALYKRLCAKGYCVSDPWRRGFEGGLAYYLNGCFAGSRKIEIYLPERKHHDAHVLREDLRPSDNTDAEEQNGYYWQVALLKSDQELADEFRVQFFSLSAVYRRLSGMGYRFSDPWFSGLEYNVKDYLMGCFTDSGRVEIYLPETTRVIQNTARVDL